MVWWLEAVRNLNLANITVELLLCFTWVINALRPFLPRQRSLGTRTVLLLHEKRTPIVCLTLQQRQDEKRRWKLNRQHPTRPCLSRQQQQENGRAIIALWTVEGESLAKHLPIKLVFSNWKAKSLSFNPSANHLRRSEGLYCKASP